MRPGDILPSRKASVEVNNTDAEDGWCSPTLALADEEAPALVISLATLTGAARVALGPDVPAFFTDDESSPPISVAPRRRSPIRSGACRSGSPTKR